MIQDAVCYDSEGNAYQSGETYTEGGDSWWVLNCSIHMIIESCMIIISALALLLVYPTVLHKWLIQKDAISVNFNQKRVHVELTFKDTTII